MEGFKKACLRRSLKKNSLSSILHQEKTVMPKFRHMTWKEHDAEHAAARQKDAEAVASGQKSAWQVQVENSFIPVDAKIAVNFDSFLRRRSLRNA